MTQTAYNSFKHWLANPPAATPLGSWLMTAAPNTAEALGYLDFDFLVLDMEHVPVDLGRTVSIMQAIAGTDTECVVRLPWNDRIMVKRTLDAGARNLMFPFIQNAEEAAEAVASTRYPPVGVRGAAAVHRGSHYGAIDDYFRTADQLIANIMQIETPEAIENIDAIAQVPGVDALFIGPGDLSVNLGYPGEISHPEIQEIIENAASRCAANDTPCGIVGGTPELVSRFIDYGYSFVAISSDMAMMLAQARNFLAAVRGEGANCEKNTPAY